MLVGGDSYLIISLNIIIEIGGIFLKVVIVWCVGGVRFVGV